MTQERDEEVKQHHQSIAQVTLDLNVTSCKPDIMIHINDILMHITDIMIHINDRMIHINNIMIHINDIMIHLNVTPCKPATMICVHLMSCTVQAYSSI